MRELDDSSSSNVLIIFSGVKFEKRRQECREVQNGLLYAKELLSIYRNSLSLSRKRERERRRETSVLIVFIPECGNDRVEIIPQGAAECVALLASIQVCLQLWGVSKTVSIRPQQSVSHEDVRRSEYTT